MRLPVLLSCVVLSGGLAVAEEPGRYAVEPSFDGFVRLDTETGSVAHCQKEAGIWRCENLIEETPGVAALRADVDKLGDRVEALDDRLGALDMRLDELAAEQPDSEPDFFTELQRRLFVLVGEIKRESRTGG